MSLRPGDRLAVYEIVELIGAGGMGQVYRANDARLRREVAIKVLSVEHAKGADALARFEREAQAVAALSHPNVLQIFDCGSDGEKAWAVTELLEGETLRDRLQRERLRPEEVLSLVRQMLDGVAAAHEKGIVHRDLKPENVFLTREGRVKILDFGLAKRAPRSSSPGSEDETLAATLPGIVLGSVGYMSPEQARGQEADFRSDVFSLGAILFEMLAGERAFPGSSAIETVSHVLQRDPSYEALPEALAPIVARCLDKDPSRRFDSVSALAAALGAAVSGSPWSQRSSATATSRPSGGSGVGGESVAVLPFANLSPDPDTEYFSDGVTDEIINRLAQIRGLRVAARTSSFHFKGTSETLSTIGEKLRVRCVVEGSVRRSGNRLRITAQLVNVADGYHLWSERFDRELDDVFAVQDEIAAAIAERLQVSLSDQRPVAPEERGNVDGDAYQLYLRGRFLYEQRSLRRALGCFECACKIDPDYAPIHAGIAQVHVFDAFMGRRLSRTVMPRALEAANRALALDERNVIAYTVLALVSWLYEWDGVQAEAAFARALELGPNVVEPHAHYSFFLGAALGCFEESVEHAEKALTLDPMGELGNSYYALALYVAGRFEAAISFLDEILRHERPSYLCWRLRGLSCHATSRFEEAAESLERALALSDRHSWCLVELAAVRLSQGDRREAEALQREAVEKAGSFGTSASYLAMVPHLLGDGESAARYLRRGLEARDGVLAIANHWPTWRAAREDARYRELFERVGL